MSLKAASMIGYPTRKTGDVIRSDGFMSCAIADQNSPILGIQGIGCVALALCQQNQARKAWQQWLSRAVRCPS